MRSFFNIIWKNFKLLLRTRTSALVIFLGPLLIVTFIGLAFSTTGAYGVNIGVYSSSYSPLADELLEKFSDNLYRIDRMGSESGCIDSVKTGENEICIVIPPGLDLHASHEISFYADYSEINLVYAVLDVIGGKVGEKSTEITEGLANELLSKIAEAKTGADTALSDISSLKSSASDASSKIVDIKSELISLVVFDVSQINMNSIGNEVGKIKSYLRDVSDSLDDAYSAVDGMGSSSARTQALEALGSARDDVEKSLAVIKSNSTSGDLETYIDNAKKVITNATTSLAMLRIAKDRSANELGAVKTKMDESLTKLSSMESQSLSLKSSLGSLTVESAERITTPLKTKIHSVVKESTYFNFIFSTLIVMIIMITSILLASTMIMSEKKSQAFFRNYITPTNDAAFNFGMFLTAFIIITAQLVLFLGVSELFFHTRIAPSLLSSSLILVLTTGFFISLGMLIGYIFKSSETNTLASISVSALLLFLSSAVLPIQSMPDRFRMIAGFNPFVIAETALRKTIFFNFTISQIRASVLLLALYFTVVMALTFIIQKAFRHNIIFHFHKKRAGMKRKAE